LFISHRVVVLVLLRILSALVDAPDILMRSEMSVKSLSCTDIKLGIGRIPEQKVLINALKSAGKLPALFLLVFKESDNYKLERSSWGEDFLVRKKRESPNDSGRSKVMLGKIKKCKVIRQKILPLERARRELAIRFCREKIEERRRKLLKDEK
ncbi:hypothetical protein MKW94_004221, partial [Papaver nudicaule]|nr:hypothetical protein [Papaver nudicaule]